MNTARPPGKAHRGSYDPLRDSSDTDYDLDRDAVWHAEYYKIADSYKSLCQEVGHLRAAEPSPSGYQYEAAHYTPRPGDELYHIFCHEGHAALDVKSKMRRA